MMKERETNNIKNVTGIAIPFFDSQNFENAFFKFPELAPFFSRLEKEIEDATESFDLLFFKKRPISTFLLRRSSFE